MNKGKNENTSPWKEVHHCETCLHNVKRPYMYIMSTEEEQSQTESSQLGPRKTVHQSGRTETGGESRLTTPNGRIHHVLVQGPIAESQRSR